MRRVIGVVAAGVLGGCAPAVLDPEGPVGAGARSILLGSVVIMLAIVVPTIVATIGIAWWFRASNTRARYLPDWNHSGRIEMIVWGIPLLTVTLLAGVAWIGSHVLDPGRPLTANPDDALEVQVVSLDWKWLFIYPTQRVASVNALVIPAGVPVRFTLTSGSVLNTFFVPRLGSMIYTMNGMATTLWLQADREGRYEGLSAHFSGDRFADMRFEVRALPPAGFLAWIKETREAGQDLNAARYAELARQGSMAPATFGEADPSLFNQIVKQELAPGPGPKGDVHEGKH